VPGSRSRWNAVCHLLDGVFFFAALISFSLEQVIPKLIQDLSDLAILIGLVALVRGLGVFLPQIFYAKKVEGLAYKKPAVLLCAVLQRVGWLGFLLSLYLRWDAAFTLPLLFVALAANGLGSGLIVPVWADWYAKTVPERLWGSLLGVRRAVPAVLGVGLGKLIQHIMNARPAPERYRILLFLALVFYGLSLLFVALVREERTEGLPNQRRTPWGAYLGDLWQIMFRRRDFRLFMVASLLVTLPVMVLLTFLTRYGLSYPGVQDGIVGTFTMFYFGSMAVGSIGGGLLSDRRGTIAPFRVFPLFVMAAAGLSVASARPAVICAAWSLVGFAYGVRMVVVLPAVFRFAGPHRRPSYSAVSFTFLGLANAVIPPLLGLGIDIDVTGFPQAFLACGVLAFAGWLLFLGMPSPERAVPEG